MKRFITALEPVWWGLFVTGTALSAILLPGWLLTVGLGVGSADALSYERAHALGASLLGRAFLVVLVVTCLWNGAHHLRHFSIDLGGLVDHDDDGAAARDLNSLALEQLDDPGRRTRDQLRPVLHQQPGTLGAETVHVLLGGNRVEDALLGSFPESLRQR